MNSFKSFRAFLHRLEFKTIFMKKFSALENCVKLSKIKDLPIPGSADMIRTFSLFI